MTALSSRETTSAQTLQETARATPSNQWRDELTFVFLSFGVVFVTVWLVGGLWIRDVARLDRELGGKETTP